MNTPKARRAREALLNVLVVALGTKGAQRLLLEYDATWACERYSETWPGCYEGLAEAADGTLEAKVEPCRSCTARGPQPEDQQHD